MLYTLLCYNDEATTAAGSAQEDATNMARLDAAHRRWAASLRPTIRLMPTTTATTVRHPDAAALDGACTESRVQLFGVYVIETDRLEQALDIARDLAGASPGGACEVRPIQSYHAGSAFRDG